MQHWPSNQIEKKRQGDDMMPLFCFPVDYTALRLHWKIVFCEYLTVCVCARGYEHQKCLRRAVSTVSRRWYIQHLYIIKMVHDFLHSVDDDSVWPCLFVPALFSTCLEPEEKKKLLSCLFFFLIFVLRFFCLDLFPLFIPPNFFCVSWNYLVL